MTPDKISETIAARIDRLPAPPPRRLIALVGPPASGKSTVAQALCDLLRARGTPTALMAMDGFHLDNRILDARGLRARKGSPETFDVAGLHAMLARVKNGEEVIAPRFDRTLDVSIGAAEVIGVDATTVIVEGNYLLLDAPGWSALHDLWDLSVLMEVPDAVLEARLLQRWADHGFDPDEARVKAEGNDLPNARMVLERSVAPDLKITC